MNIFNIIGNYYALRFSGTDALNRTNKIRKAHAISAIKNEQKRKALADWHKREQEVKDIAAIVKRIKILTEIGFSEIYVQKSPHVKSHFQSKHFDVSETADPEQYRISWN